MATIRFIQHGYCSYGFLCTFSNRNAFKSIEAETAGKNLNEKENSECHFLPFTF